MRRRENFEYIRERWAEARRLGSWNLLLAPLVCVPFIIAALLIGQGVDLLNADVPGSVTIASCERTEDGWNCDGGFTAADGSVHIDWVRLYPYFAQVEEPSGTVAARVSGPGATQADRSDDAFPVPLWSGIAIGLIGLYWAYSVYLKPGDAKSIAVRRRSRR